MSNIQLSKEQFVISNRLNTGAEIRKFRLKKGFSQDHLADLMSINRATISKIENGKFAISVDYLAKFAWHLDFDIAFIENVRQA